MKRVMLGMAVVFLWTASVRADDGLPLPPGKPAAPPPAVKPPEAKSPADTPSDPDFPPVVITPQPATLSYAEDPDGKPVNIGGNSFVSVINSLAEAIQKMDDAGGSPGGGGVQMENNQGAAVLRLDITPTLKKINGKYVVTAKMEERGWSVDPGMKADSRQQCGKDRSDVEKGLSTWSHTLTESETADYLAGKDVSITIDGPFADLVKLRGNAPTFSLGQKLLVENGSVPGANDNDIP